MPDAFITIKKDRGDRWIFAVSFDWFLEILYFPGRVFKTLFSGLVDWLLTWNFPSTKVTMSIASTGLVAGLMIVIVGQVFTRPTSLLAVPAFVNQQHFGPLIDRIKIEGIGYNVGDTESYTAFFSIPRKTISHLQTSGRPTESSAIQVLIGYTHPARSLLQKINLGDEITLVGDNNGRYSYTVVTTQVRSKEDLPKLQTDSEQLMLIIPQTAVQQQFLVVIAR
jgi:hypothetical protein